MKFPKLFPDRGASKALTVARTSARIQTKALPVISYPAELFWLNGNPTQDPLSPHIGQRRAFAAMALVYACMTYRATKLSEGPLWIVDETDDGEAWLKGEHELSALLERPNPDMSMADLLELLSLYDDATGAWLLVLNRNRLGRVGSMYPYARDEFSVEPGNGQLYGKFGVQTLDGYRTFGPDEVIYFKRPSLASLYSATSKVDAALSHVNIGDQMRQAIASMLRRAIRPGAKVEVPGNLYGDAPERLKADYAAKFQGYANAGELLIVEGGGKLEMLQTGLKDLEFGPVNTDVEAAVCQCFQLHPAVVAARLGVENSSGFADLVDSATKLAYDVAFIPTWTRMAEKLTQRLLRPIDDSPRRFLRFDLTKIRALQKDMTAAVEQASKASAFWTVNEQRAHTNKKPIADGDEIRIPVAPGTDPNEDDDERDDEAKKSAFKARSIRVVTGVAIAAVSLSAAWSDFDQKATREEQRYQQAAVTQLERERDRVVRTIEDAVPGSKAEETDEERLRRLIAATLIAPYLEVALVRIAADYAASGLYHREWQQRFERLVRQTVKLGGKEVAAAIGVSFEVSNPRVRDAIQQRVTKLAGEVTDTTLARVREVITEARNDGVGMTEITKRIRDDAFGGTITTSRARTIARTETVGALNEGEHLAAIESGVMQSKRWLSQGDGRVRDDHRADNDAGWIPIADRYPNSGLHYPHEPGAPAEQVINCRCSQLFSDLTADEANRGHS